MGGGNLWIAWHPDAAPVRRHVAHALPQDDGMHYVFGKRDVRFRAVDGDMNRIVAEVRAAGSAPIVEPVRAR